MEERSAEEGKKCTEAECDQSHVLHDIWEFLHGNTIEPPGMPGSNL
jgi:hypothetical protein